MRAYVILIPLVVIVLGTIWTTRRIWELPATPGDRRRLWTFVLGSLAALLVSVRVPLHELSTGIDGSYPHVLNQLAFGTTVFGRDVIYTYGPLGWLLAAEQVNDHLLLATVFWVAMYACLSVLVIACSVCFAAGGRRAAALLCSVAVLWFVDTERLVCCMCFLLAIVGYRLPAHRTRMLLLGGLLAAMAATIKFSGGVICGAALASGALLPLAARPTAGRLLWLGSGFAVSFVMIWLLIYGSLAGSVDYFVRSLQISSGYTASMAVGQLEEAASLGAFLTAIALVFVLAGSVRGWRAHTLLVFAAPMFIAWKHGVVRYCDTHIIGLAVTSMFLGLVAMLVALWAGVTARSFAIRVGGLLLIAVLLDRGMAIADFPRPVQVVTPMLSLRSVHFSQGVRSLARLAYDWDGVNAEMRANGAARMARFRLPEKTRAAIGDGTVDYYSTDLSFLTNELNWKSKPVFQHFNAFTPGLDRWNAEFYSGDDRPDFVVVHSMFGLVSIDHRHVLFDDPVAQVAILDHYEGADPSQITSPASVLLRRTDVRRFDEPVKLGEQIVRMGETIPVPSTSREGILRARIVLESSLFQDVKQALLRLGPLHLTYTLTGGEEATYRMLPLHLADGVWIEPYFPTVTNYYAFMARETHASQSVESIRISTIYSSDFPDTLALEWELLPERRPGLRRSVTPLPGPTGDSLPVRLAGAVEAAFPATSDPIDSVNVKLSTYLLESSGPIQLQLLDASANVLGESQIDAARVQDNGYNGFEFKDTAAFISRVTALRLIYSAGGDNHIAYWPFQNGNPGFECKVFGRAR